MIKTITDNHFTYINPFAISPEEKARVERFLKLIAYDVVPNWKDPHQMGSLQRQIGILRVYGDDPGQAASAWLEAICLSKKAFHDYCMDFSLALPPEEQQRWSQAWDNGQELPEQKQMIQEAERVMDKTMEQAFDERIYQYLDEIHGI